MEVRDITQPELILRPSGKLVLWGLDGDGKGDPDAWTKRVARGFSSCQAAGLFAMAVGRPDSPPPPSLSFWRDFACRYMTELCRTPDPAGKGLEPVEPPGPEEINSIPSNAPPMKGGEYLNGEVLNIDNISAY